MTYAKEQRRKARRINAMTQALLDQWATLPVEYRKLLVRQGIHPNMDKPQQPKG